MENSAQTTQFYVQQDNIYGGINAESQRSTHEFEEVMVEKPEMGRAQDSARKESGADEISSAILDAALDGIVMCDDERRYVYANRAATALLGVDHKCVVDKRLDDFPGLLPSRRDWAEFMRHGSFCGESTLVRPDGSITRIEVRARAHCLPGQHIVFIRDISDRACLITETIDAERLRLAHDLHDAVGQTLSLVKLSLKRAEHDAKPNALRLAEPLNLIDDLIRQVRTMIFDLHPAMLEDLGLVPTLENYVEQLRYRTGLRITIAEIGERQPLAAPAPNCLFRAAKELLANAAKHASAAAIVLTVQWEPERLRLIVDDDGVGIEIARRAASYSAPTLGLASVQERAAALGGHMRIESHQGHGTRVAIDVALPISVTGKRKSEWSE